jgi:hypothetical protein
VLNPLTMYIVSPGNYATGSTAVFAGKREIYGISVNTDFTDSVWGTPQARPSGIGIALLIIGKVMLNKGTPPVESLRESAVCR